MRSKAPSKPAFWCRRSVESHGRVLNVFRRGPAAPDTLSAQRVASILSRRRRRLPGESVHPILGNSDLPVEEEEPQADGGSGASCDETACLAPASVPTTDLVRAVRAAAEPPRAADVATVLLLAQSMPNGKDPLRHALRVLRLRQPIVTIFCEAKGFEEGFLDLLKRGMVLPGAVARCNGYDHSRSDPFQFDRMLNAKWRIISFAGFERDPDITEFRIGDAARSVFPILAVAERIERLPSKFVQAAQLNLACGRLNAAIVLRTIKTVLGEAPADQLDGIDFTRLELADLAIAIRPGVTPDAAVESLRKLASTANRKSSDDGSIGSRHELEHATDPRIRVPAAT